MPRVEIIEPDKAVAPSSTVDYCRGCFREYEIREGDLLFDIFGMLDDVHPETRYGSTDVEHPSYEDDDYRCELCDARLTAEDN